MTDVAGKTVILVDDGLAMGTSMRAAVHALRQLRPAWIVIAVPAASEPTYRELSAMVDEVVCATTPSPAFAISSSYWDFTQPTADEVRNLLRTPALPRLAGTGGRGLTEAAVIRAAAVPVANGVPPDDALFDLVADAPLVLIGAATNGTHEFYAARARMTRRLIEDRGFCAVVATEDWPAAYRVNRYVRGHGSDVDAAEALRGFEGFPAWTWRNTAVRDFVGWLRAHNDRMADERAMAGVYGLDLHSRYRSIHEVISYLDQVDPAAAGRARERLGCIDHYQGNEGQNDCFAAAFGAGETSEREATDRLIDLDLHALEDAFRDGLLAEDRLFYTEQNARIVRDAEEYHRSLFTGRPRSWTLRERDMFATLHALIDHLGRRYGRQPKIVVWAHSSHVCDARATEATVGGEVNFGQLVREAYPGDCCLIGFTTYTGTVTATDTWGGPAERMRLRPALPDSVEELLHNVGDKEFLIPFRVAPHAAEALRAARLERAIGIIYLPQTERLSHYSRARLADQFDAVIQIDETRALEPLERTAH